MTKLEKIYVVLGPPGSGKGTQSELLARQLNWPRFVIGDLRREFIKGESSEAKEDKVRYDKGIPAPDEIVSKLLRDAIGKLQDASGIVLDTYPLSMGQVTDLDQVALDLGVQYLRVLFLNVDKEEVVKRIISRKKNSTVVRSDDTPEIAGERFEEYEKRNAPIKEYYKGKEQLIEINGDQVIEAVHEEIMKKLKSA